MKTLVLISLVVWSFVALAQQPQTPPTSSTGTSQEVKNPSPTTDTTTSDSEGSKEKSE